MISEVAVIDLFAGSGGWDVGAVALGLDPLGIEWDDAACRTREAAGLRTLQKDIAHLEPFGAEVGVIASPPCPSFSAAGKGLGRKDFPAIEAAALVLASGADPATRLDPSAWHDERSALVLEPLRWALLRQPIWTVWEQVPSVLPFWEMCAEFLTAEGYSVWTGYLHAEQYGVPQTRKRAILIASRHREVSQPAPTHSRYYPRDPGRLDEGVEPWISMAEALGWEEGAIPAPSPTVTAGGTKTGGAEVFASKGARPRALRSTQQPRVNTRGNRTTPGGNEFSSERPAWALTEKARSWKLINGAQANATQRRGGDTHAGGVVPDDWPARRPATSVACDPRISKPGRHDPNVSGSQQKDAIRITPEQAATLQSFPADYPFQGSRTKQFEQIGNAIPPLLAAAILREVV